MIRKIVSNKVFRWVIMGLYAGLIFLASSINFQLDSSDSFYIEVFSFIFYVEHIDKCIHFIEYAIFCAILCWALSAHLNGNQIRKIIIIAVILTSLYGVTDEFHQSFIPTRNATIYDWLTDTLGAAVAALCWLKIFSATEGKARHK